MKSISTTSRVTPYVQRFCLLVASGSADIDDAYDTLMSTEFIRTGGTDPTVALTPNTLSELVNKKSTCVSQKKRYMGHFFWFIREMHHGNVTTELLQRLGDNVQRLGRVVFEECKFPVAQLSFLTFLFQLLRIYPDPSIISRTRSSIIEALQELVAEEYDDRYMMYVCCKLLHLYCPEGVGMLKRAECSTVYKEFEKSTADRAKLAEVVKAIEQQYWTLFAVGFDIGVFDAMSEYHKSEALLDDVLRSARKDVLSWNAYVSIVDGFAIVPTVGALVEQSFDTLDLPLLQLMAGFIRELSGIANAKKNEGVGSVLWDLILDKVIKFCDLHYKTKDWQLPCTSIIQSLFWCCTERIDEIRESFQPSFQRWVDFAGKDDELLPHLNCIMFLKIRRNSKRQDDSFPMDMDKPLDFDDWSASDFDELLND